MVAKSSICPTGATDTENIASQLPDVLSVAVEKSSRLMAEDLCREAGFMLPQSSNTRLFLESIKTYPGIPVDAVESLLKNIQFNEKTEEKKMEKWKCTVCGYIHEGPMTPDFKCPVCKQPADKFVKIEDAAAPAKNPYAGTKTCLLYTSPSPRDRPTSRMPSSA